MTKELVGRLAMRVEGTMWNAYYATTDTMVGAIFLGSIQMRFVQSDARKATFMKLMKDAVGDILEEVTGTRPIWPEGPKLAPEHERTRE